MPHIRKTGSLVLLLSKFAVLCLLVFVCTQPAFSADSDYLTPDLRARVDKLKADVAFLPTDAFNQEERARILWQWANAFALNGGDLPVNITQAVAGIFAYPDLARRQTNLGLSKPERS
jgi:hypothetical protein